MDTEFLLALLLIGVIATGAAGIAMWLCTQGPSSLISHAWPLAKVPPHEKRHYIRTVMEAIVMARQGKPLEGYDHLLAARRRLLTEANAGEEWVEVVAHWYQQTLNRYVSRHGLE
jgi:hypothetical protein